MIYVLPNIFATFVQFAGVKMTLFFLLLPFQYNTKKLSSLKGREFGYIPAVPPTLTDVCLFTST